MMNEIEKIPKENPFKVPERYFEDMTDSIMQAVSKVPLVPAPEKKLYRISPWIAAAAGFAIIAALSITFILFNNGKKEADFFTGLSYNGTVEEIFYNMDITAIEEEIAAGMITGRFSEVDNPDIIEYLVMQNINILDIYEYF